ncbi:ABC transporter substrate-binding protein [Paenibacillus macquariensis]|uniref:Iron complex transport system substrate-binding protein n=1 Tax=Paenibacillus macquariensis TaxID=948756 RepID=A0ABY1K4D1_9BACL|nr:ABC transporter substrate-binding protein [Paenibacillus macquariensis]SIR24264.1 iron complex transport system substrate-binding protein [Paenibacillus macquariensis]
MYSRQKNHRPQKLGLVIPLMFLLIVLVLSACGGTETKTASNSETAEQPRTEENSSTNTSSAVKTVTTLKGEIEVPVKPQRIVAEEYLGSMIALGVIPVGAPELTIKNYYFKDKLVGVSDIGTYGKPSVEKTLALNPDLIITGNGDNYEALSKIAPTIVIPYGDLKGVHEELTYFGELLDKEEEAKTWLLQYDQRIAEAKAKVDIAIATDASFSIMEDGGKSTWVYGDNFGRGGQPIYQALGRKPPSVVASEIMEKQWAELSEEMIEKYAGDYIIMTSNERTIEDFQKDPIWGSVPAVKNGHIYVWPEERSWYYDPIAVLAQIEELTTWLTSLDK